MEQDFFIGDDVFFFVHDSDGDMIVGKGSIDYILIYTETRNKVFKISKKEEKSVLAIVSNSWSADYSRGDRLFRTREELQEFVNSKMN